MNAPDYRTASLGELIQMAVEKELVDFCYLTRKMVIISMSNHQLSFPLEEARPFLRSLVQGWFRHQVTETGDESASGALPGYGHFDGPVPRRRTVGAEPPKTASSNLKRESFGAKDDYLDAVLAFAVDIGLVVEYEKFPATQRVRIRTRAATTELSYFETLEYLNDAIVEELRAKPV